MSDTTENATFVDKHRTLWHFLPRLLALAKPEWRRLSVGTVFLLVGTGLGLAYPQAIRIILDQAQSGTGTTSIDVAAMAMLGIFAAQGIAIAIRHYLFTVSGEHVVARLRERLYRHIVGQEIGFFDARRTGELTNRLSSDTSVLQNTVSVNISMVLRNAATVIGGVGLLSYTSPILTLLMLAVVPPTVVAAAYFGRRVRRLSRDVQDRLARAGEVAEETIAGIRTVRSFAREEQEVRRYGAAVMEAFDSARRRTFSIALFSGAATFAGYAAVALVLWYGGRLVVGGEMTVGALTAFILYTLLVAFSFGALGGLWADFMRAAGAAERVFDLLDRQAEIPSGEGERLGTVRGQIGIENVSFAYPARSDVTVLEDVSLTIEPDEVVALVGPSGGGKSTIASLIPRFYDPGEGRITLDGRDIRDLDATWLREQVGSVAQEPVLLSTTVAANIRYGRPGAADHEVEAAARAANAVEFIESFPDRFETLVGERGVQLSGGQKQRIAIARALLKDPAILILDEATSALDADSEYLVREALDRLMKGRTTLIIAHRLSTVIGADRVLVIDQGRVVESGSHAALMEHNEGLYRRLVERQLLSA
jgi:ATP-binding cassette subfamily B protein